MKNNQDLLNFIKHLNNYFAITDPTAKSKMGYGLRRVKPQAQKLFDSYSQTEEDLQVEHCIEENGKIVTNEQGNYCFSKDGKREYLKAHRALLEKEIEFEPYMVTNVPEDLPVVFADAFRGFVLPEEIEEPEDKTD